MGVEPHQDAQYCADTMHRTATGASERSPKIQISRKVCRIRSTFAVTKHNYVKDNRSITKTVDDGE